MLLFLDALGGRNLLCFTNTMCCTQRAFLLRSVKALEILRAIPKVVTDMTFHPSKQLQNVKIAHGNRVRMPYVQW